jgi:hypothetical protein
MLHAPHRVDPGSSQGPTRTHSPRGPDRRSRTRRRAIVRGPWDDSFILFDARIRRLHLWATGVRELSSSLELDWCIACLADVRSALYQLHVAVLEEHPASVPHDAPIVAYLSEAYVWCGDVLDDVQALVQKVRGDPSVRGEALGDDSSAYIDEFLTPLFRQICDSGGGMAPGGRPPRAYLPLAERLHAAIVSLNWVLRAA